MDFKAPKASFAKTMKKFQSRFLILEFKRCSRILSQRRKEDHVNCVNEHLEFVLDLDTNTENILLSEGWTRRHVIPQRMHRRRKHPTTNTPTEPHTNR